ncbi:unnamed protein product [Pleuronectes platessa]|uniref:Uncharacterized protein n=1 Tax=Pleuronectes platessa TaxID=8262 RepID=A0A9N7UB37_PLEPL|nr:unnamed protein product [Pleuronectes platessa]
MSSIRRGRRKRRWRKRGRTKPVETEESEETPKKKKKQRLGLKWRKKPKDAALHNRFPPDTPRQLVLRLRTISYREKEEEEEEEGVTKGRKGGRGRGMKGRWRHHENTKKVKKYKFLKPIFSNDAHIQDISWMVDGVESSVCRNKDEAEQEQNPKRNTPRHVHSPRQRCSPPAVGYDAELPPIEHRRCDAGMDQKLSDCIKMDGKRALLK